MKRMITCLILVYTLSLSGCVVPVFIAGAAAGGAVIYDKRSVKTMGEDQQTYQYAQRWLNEDPVLKDHSHIVVAVFNHVALLIGQAQTPEIRDRAYQILVQVAKKFPISRIYNEITIAGNTTFVQRSNDSWVTTKVRTALLAKKGLASNNIKVITENSVVYLMGDIGRSQAKLAADAARRVQGVQKVVKVFTYD